LEQRILVCTVEVELSLGEVTKDGLEEGVED